MFGLFIHKNKNIIVLIVLLTFSFVFISSRSNKLNQWLANGFLTFALPVTGFIHSINNNIFSTWDDLINLKEKLAEIDAFKKEFGKEKIKRLIYENEHLNNEIQRFKKLLDYKEAVQSIIIDDSTVESITADIIMKDPESFYQTLIINKGSYHGIRENMPVVTFQIVRKKGRPETLERIVVGKISQVTYIASKIVPIIDPQCVIHAKFRYSDYTGLLQGRGNYAKGIVLTQLDKMATFSTGEEILTSGGQSVFPKGIKVGRVIKDITSGTSYMKKVLVEPYIDFSRLETVLVIKRELPEQLKILLGHNK